MPADRRLRRDEAPVRLLRRPQRRHQGKICDLAAKANEKLPEKLAAVGEWVSLSDSAWAVGGVVDWGHVLPSGNTFVRDAQTTGRFIVVRFNIQNNMQSEERIFADPELVDRRGRRFKTFDRQRRYLPEDAHAVALEALPAGVLRDFWAIYEVADDAEDMAFEARALSALGEKRLIALGKIPGPPRQR